MRIALFTETYFPSVNGVAAHVKTLRNGLIELGHEVLVVTADKHCKHHYIEDGVLRCPSIEIKRIYGFGAASPISRKRMKMISDFKPDIVHIHHEFGIGISGILCARTLNIPLIYTLHTMYDQYIYYVAPRPLLRVATRFSHKYERFIALRANALTGPSKKCSEYFERIGVQKEVNLIPNSADLELFRPDVATEKFQNEFREKHGIPKDSMLACFVGRLGQEKSIDVLLNFWAETIKKQDRLHLVIIGEGPEGDALKQQVKDLGISDMITFTGLVSHDTMPLYFASCDIYITASLSEMNSISMLEAMASGLPILQRYDELNADQISSGVNGYLFHTAGEMSEKLLEIRALSTDELSKLKNRVSDSVRSRGGIDLANYMLDVYEKASLDRKFEPRSQRTPIRVPIRFRRK